MHTYTIDIDFMICNGTINYHNDRADSTSYQIEAPNAREALAMLPTRAPNVYAARLVNMSRGDRWFPSRIVAKIKL